MKIKNTLCLSMALGIVGAAAAQDIPLIINGPLTDDITNRANDITFTFTSSGQSPAANVGWGTNPPDSFRLTLDLSNSTKFPSYYSVQLFKGVDSAIYTPGPFVRMVTPYTFVIPGGFDYQLQKGVTYRLGLYDVALIDRPDAATEDARWTWMVRGRISRILRSPVRSTSRPQAAFPSTSAAKRSSSAKAASTHPLAYRFAFR